MYVWFQSLFKCRRLPVSLDCPFLFKISMDLDEGQVRLILRTMKWKKKMLYLTNHWSRQIIDYVPLRQSEGDKNR